MQFPIILVMILIFLLTGGECMGDSVPAIVSKNVGNTLTNYTTWGGILFNITDVAYGGKGDAVTDNLAAFNAAKLASGANRTVYFPQNSTGTAEYYFSTSPDFSNVVIDCQDGVILSLPSTNGVTFGTIKNKNGLKIKSRDRNNTGYQPPAPNGIDWLPILTAGDISQPMGLQKPSVLDATTFIKRRYDAGNDTVVTGSATLTSSQEVDWSTGAIPNSASLIDVVLTPAVTGKQYLASLSAPGNDSSTGRSGIIITAGDSSWYYFSVNYRAQWALGTKQVGVAWSETALKNLPSGAYQVWQNNANAVMSARIVSPTEVEFYINGLFVTRKTLSANIEYVGYGFTGTANILGICAAYDFVAGDVPQRQTGDYLNIAVMGDSISFGEGSNLPWPNLLTYALKGMGGIANVTITNFAVSGETSGQQKDRLLAGNMSSYDYVLILVGTNDIQMQVGPTVYRNNLIAMIQKVVADGSVPIIGVPPMFIDQASTGYGFATTNYGLGGTYRSAVFRVAAEQGVYVADVMSDFGKIGADNVQLRDNIHPNALADPYIARSFAQAIMQLEAAKKVTLLPSIRRDGANTVMWASAMPTAGYWKQGDEVLNTSPAITGTAGSRYVVRGWKRITTGVANVLNTDWVEERMLTGT